MLVLGLAPVNEAEGIPQNRDNHGFFRRLANRRNTCFVADRLHVSSRVPFKIVQLDQQRRAFVSGNILPVAVSQSALNRPQ